MVAFAAPRQARACDMQRHGEVGLIHALGSPQQQEYGFGAGVAVAGELPLASVVGLQAELSFLVFRP